MEQCRINYLYGHLSFLFLHSTAQVFVLQISFTSSQNMLRKHLKTFPKKKKTQKPNVNGKLFNGQVNIANFRN
jgi:hypothetical protein